ncbi:MAG: hypothetical protein KF729_13755 [Sandaracinaceae bacterium]|nr:hypothetical protein [Sandaracinaceae bacterium]
MSAIPEAVVAAVVADVSARMAEPAYAQLAIGEVVSSHPAAGQYIGAHADTLGGGEGVMQTVFHAHVIDECFTRHRGRATRAVGFRELDAAVRATLDPAATLSARQPAIASYVASNAEGAAQLRLLALFALALDRA